MTRKFRFTGWHMLGVMCLFFGTVITVNVVMAAYATRTFGGVVVKNSYVASQQFNTWLEEAKAQERLGWTVSARSIDGRLVVEAKIRSGALAGADVSATARHPFGRMEEVQLRFVEAAQGRYIAQNRLPPGRWRIHLRIGRAHHRADFIREVTT